MTLTLRARNSPLSSAAGQIGVLSATGGLRPFEERMAAAGLHPLRSEAIRVLQINLGGICNQACAHCHVDAGPERREIMTRETMELCLGALERTETPVVDITGGAPELSPVFRRLVEGAAALGRHVTDRCNLTVLLLPSQAGLAEFLARHRVEVIASLPYHRAAQTDLQRGAGVFADSLEALRRLNRLGYGKPGSGLLLDLVCNPVGAFLPPRQEEAEARFKAEMERQYGIVFNRLYTITNMPIGRFLDFLLRTGNYERYMERLASAFNPAAAAGVMCRYTLSVGWDGALYDCDFNQMLGLSTDSGVPSHVRDFDPERLGGRRIVTHNHCYGCTAGAGSSCGGSTAP